MERSLKELKTQNTQQFNELKGQLQTLPTDQKKLQTAVQQQQYQIESLLTAAKRQLTETEIGREYCFNHLNTVND